MIIKLLSVTKNISWKLFLTILRQAFTSKLLENLEKKILGTTCITITCSYISPHNSMLPVAKRLTSQESIIFNSNNSHPGSNKVMFTRQSHRIHTRLTFDLVSIAAPYSSLSTEEWFDPRLILSIRSLIYSTFTQTFSQRTLKYFHTVLNLCLCCDGELKVPDAIKIFQKWDLIFVFWFKVSTLLNADIYVIKSLSWIKHESVR